MPSSILFLMLFVSSLFFIHQSQLDSTILLILSLNKFLAIWNLSIYLFYPEKHPKDFCPTPKGYLPLRILAPDSAHWDLSVLLGPLSYMIRQVLPGRNPDCWAHCLFFFTLRDHCAVCYPKSNKVGLYIFFPQLRGCLQ